MAEYGYEYRIFSTYSTGTVRNETREPVNIKPFVPSLPKSNGNKEGHVTRKTIVPITSSRPYDDDSATEKYPSRGGNDDNQWYRQTSPYYGGNKEGRKPVGSTIRNDNHDGYNNGTNGYGSDYGGNKEWAKPVASTIRNGDYGTNNGYGGADYGGNKEGPKQPIGRSAIRKNDNHDGYNGTNNIGYGDKGGRNKKDNYDHHDQYDDDDHYYYNNNNNKKEGHKPTSLPIGKNDGYNNNNNNYGYGIGNGNNKEQRRPFGSTTRNNNTYDDDDVNYNNRGGHKHNPNGPKISSDWTKAPRKGTQLSEPTHDIEKALELLRMEAAKREQSNANNKDDYEYEYDRPPSSTPLANWAAPAPGNGSRFHDLITSKFDKGTGSPRSQSSMTMEPALPNKGGNYGSETDDHDRKGPLGSFANFNLPSRPRTQTIDSRNAVEMYNGTRV